MSTIFKGAQLDLYPSITTDSKGKALSYQQMFILRKPSASNDQADSENKGSNSASTNESPEQKEGNNEPLFTESMSGLEKGDGNNRFLDNYKGLLNKNKIEKRP